MKYVQELRKYINVDIYGRCGDIHYCDKDSEYEDCRARTVRQYKFYLSFENSNCREYITEKVFGNALK